MKSNIRKLRNEKQITQSELAQVIGKTQQAVSQMEQDRERISIESLITMADYFDVSTDYILGIEEKKPSPAKAESDVSDQEWLQKETDSLRRIIESDDNQLLYELILSLLLISLKEKPASAAALAEGITDTD